MSEVLRLYHVTINGHKTSMRLNPADAAAYGSGAVLVEQPHPVPRPPEHHAQAEPAGGKSRLVTSNKMRGVDDHADRSREGVN